MPRVLALNHLLCSINVILMILFIIGDLMLMTPKGLSANYLSHELHTSVTNSKFHLNFALASQI